MLRIERSKIAAEDLKSIWHFIADQNPTATDAQNARLEMRFALLAQMPELGTQLTGFAGEIRYFTVGGYVIYYRVVGETLRILRVLHGARDILPLLEEN